MHIENHYHFNKRVVKKFVYETDRVVSRDFLRGSREERVKRFREYGKVAPELEKVQLEARRKELAGKGRRPGRDFRIHEQAAEDKVAKAEVQKLVAKNPNQYPQLTKVRKEDWDQPAPRRGRNGKGAVADDTPAFDAGGKGKGKNRTIDETPTLDRKNRSGDASVDPGGKGKGKARNRGGDDTPAFEGTSKSGKGRNAAPSVIESDTPSRKKGKDQPAFDAERRQRKEGKGRDKATPTLVRRPTRAVVAAAAAAAAERRQRATTGHSDAGAAVRRGRRWRRQ